MIDNNDDFIIEFRKAAKLPSANWVEWIHESKGKTHCMEYLVLDKCWFTFDNKPKYPKHLFCHCKLQQIPQEFVVRAAKAESTYSKIDPYLFDTNGTYGHGKNKVFESWGYTISDATWLHKEIERQGFNKYISGDYSLGRLNEQGQRINIRIELERKDETGSVSFVSGWMVRPNGYITLNTPYGGK